MEQRAGAGTAVLGRLVVAGSGELRGAVLSLDDDDLLVGRDRSAVDVHLDDEHVSRVHARLRRVPSGVSILDLGSKGGTLVNGVPATDELLVHPGDHITFATLETVYEHDGGAPRPVADDATVAARQLDAGNQSAGQINNVLGDQYIQLQRSEFVEDLATMKSRGSRLLIFGFIVGIVGFAIYGYVVFSFIDEIPNFGPATTPEDVQLLGPKVGGVPLGAIGFGLCGLGSVLMVVGIVLHVVAAARRRAWNRDHPDPRAKVYPGARP